MTQTVLVLGASGRFGRNAVLAFAKAGWTVRGFDRKSDDLLIAAQGADVIVNAWNPPYTEWAKQVVPLHAKVIEAAKLSGSTVIVPGNVYVFGADTPGPWSGATPHLATNPLGRIRRQMEEAYRASTVRTILLRAGDFIDTEASGNWFDQVMIKPLAKGKFVYPGDPDIPHAWAYLPDLARAAVALAEIRGELPRFAEVPFAGFTVTGRDIAEGLSRVLRRPVSVKEMSWWPLELAQPFWPMARHLIEMRYLWNTPNCLDCTHFETLVGPFVQTDFTTALASAVPAGLLGQEIHPDQPVTAGA